MSAEPLLRVERLTKVFGGGPALVRAVDGVDLVTDAGELTLVMGPSGSGKTTLLSIVGGILRPTEGRVVLDGVEITALPRRALPRVRRELVGFVFQSFNLLESLSALENVEIALNVAGVRGAEATERARALLVEAGLGKRLGFNATDLSAGERQRVAIARALANRPRLLLADEPTANLDSEHGREVMALLRDLTQRKRNAALVVSHDERLLEIADRVFRLEGGRIRAVEPARAGRDARPRTGGRPQKAVVRGGERPDALAPAGREGRRVEGSSPVLVAIVAHKNRETNACLAAAWRTLGLDARVLAPDEAVRTLRRGDLALLRLDVLPTVDGFETGLGRVPELRHAGVRILNPPWALLGAHDKLETARRLAAAGVRHPRTGHVTRPGEAAGIDPPLVVKPRYGSWGLDVFRCDTEEAVQACLRAVEGRSWFRRHGALVQELVPPPARDLRVVVAGGAVVGAAGREPAPGEWRTNVSLGGRRVAVEPDEEARRLALAAVEAVGGDLVGVDLLPLPDGSWTVLELNGAVDFDDTYSLGGAPVHVRVAEELGLLAAAAGAAAA